MIFEFGQYRADIDVDKTKQFYKNEPLLSQGCSCDGCRNFEKAVERLPEKVKAFFNDLGIDMKKVCEIYVNYTNSDGSLYYGGFCHICGTLLSGKSAWIPIDETVSCWEETQAFKVDDGFYVSFQKECSLLEEGFPTPALQLEISAKNIPWVLEKENTYL